MVTNWLLGSVWCAYFDLSLFIDVMFEGVRYYIFKPALCKLKP